MFIRIYTSKIRATWIQASKSGPIINFNRWQDWNGKTLRGLSWYKEEEDQEFEGLFSRRKMRIFLKIC